MANKKYDKRRALFCKLLGESKTYKGYYKYLVTIGEKDGTIHKQPVYGRDMQSALNRLINKELTKFNPLVDNEKLSLSYDKNKNSIKEIIQILNKYNINFTEINTYESNLEDVFKKLVIQNGNN